MHEKNFKTKLAKFILLISTLSLFACVPLVVIMLMGELESLQRFFWHIVGGGMVAAVGVVCGVVIWDNSLPVTKVRVIVVSRGESGVSDMVSGAVVFETEQGETIKNPAA